MHERQLSRLGEAAEFRPLQTFTQRLNPGTKLNISFFNFCPCSPFPSLCSNTPVLEELVLRALFIMPALCLSGGEPSQL